MNYDFDKIYDRRNTNSLKYDFAAERGVPQDALPLWVADMDFRVPEEIITALKQRMDHGIFGYTDPKPDYYAALCGWFEMRHNWRTQPEGWLITCSVVFAISSLLRAVTAAGDAVIICQPVYYPFAESVQKNGRKLIISDLKNDGGHYAVDYDDFEKKISENNVKAFILCNPHNPVGRVWTKEELERMGDICLKHNVFVISDEIHADFVFAGHTHTAFPAVKKQFEDICAVCTAPTKTFNIAGLHVSNVYVSNEKIRKRYRAELDAIGYSQPNIAGMLACLTAYTFGADWLDGLLEYLDANISFAEEYIRLNLPQIGFLRPEGTYLIWLDCRRLGLDNAALSAFMQNKAKLWLDDGYIFGESGSGFERINVACPRSVLKTALERLKNAVDGI